MIAPARPRLLHISNRTRGPARVRLICSNQTIWDTWVTPAGTVCAPAFVPERLALEARLTERATHVSYMSSLTDVHSTCVLVARLVQKQGARMFAVSSHEELPSPALRMRNETAEPLEFVVRYPASPYRLAGFVAPHRTTQIAYSDLELLVVHEGLSAQQRLVAPNGAWVISSTSESRGFPVLEPLDALAHDNGLHAQE